MPHRYDTHQLRLRPDYRYFTLRDAECDASIDADQALRDANTRIAAGTGYELYVVVGQDMIPVVAELEIWRDEPTAPDGDDWAEPMEFSLECPSGQLRLGDATLTAISVDLPDGTGVYRVRLYHRGRARAREALRAFTATHRDLSPIQLNRELQRFADIEQYRLQMWRVEDLSGDEDDA